MEAEGATLTCPLLDASTNSGEREASSIDCMTKKLVWCSEVCHKAFSLDSRSEVAQIASDVGAGLECFKKANTFGRWLGRENPTIVYLLTDWREAKPCSDEIFKASEEQPSLGMITMLILCTDKQVASRAQTWASRTRKDPNRCFYPRIVRNLSEAHGLLGKVAARHRKGGASLLFSSDRRVPHPPAQPPEALNWAQMPLLPPPTMSHTSLVDPQVMLSPATTAFVQMPVCTAPWMMPRTPLPSGPMAAELPQPVHILEQRTAPSSPPLPEFLGSRSIGSTAASAADVQADVDTNARIDVETDMEPQFQRVNRLVAKLLEFNAWVPGTMAKESTSAAGAAAAGAAAVAAEADTKEDEDA